MVPLHGAELRDQRGFTLIEMMVVVAVIAILAVVVIPQFFGSSRKVKAETEVTPLLAEISIRQEQERSENGAYAALAECPTTTTPTGVASTTCTTSAEWTALRINAPINTLRCKYQTWTGTGVGTNAPGAPGTTGFVWSSPSVNWYYIVATCDADGVTTDFSTYFMASSDAKIQKYNEGK